MATNIFTTILTSLIIIISSSHQPFALNHTPNFPSSSKSYSSSSQLDIHYETKFFQQRLDHFSFSNSPTFPQRYLINTQNWVVGSGPIFLYCGNEGDIVWFAQNTGFLWEIAPKFGAMLVFPEHRYYGESVPFGSKEEAYKNANTLGYLNAGQALFDFAVLVTDLKRNYSANASPVVLFGGSYGGMLAAWMRLKYPHIAVGALASSAPILQFEDIVPPETFYDIVSNGFKRESSSCFNYIKQSWDDIESKGQTSDGLELLTKTFRFCQKLKSTEDLWNWLESAYSYLAMVNYPYPSEFLMPLPGHPIKEAWRSIIRLDQNQLGNKSSVTHESYLKWVIGRATQTGMSYPMLRPLTSATSPVPPPFPSKTMEDYQRRLHEANLEGDAWKMKYQTSKREKDTIMGILEQTSWQLQEKERENAELKDLLRRKDAIIDRMPGSRRRRREFFAGATTDSEE